MKSLLTRFSILFLLIFSFSCSDKDGEIIPVETEIQDFVWKGLNAYYFWQQDIPDLSDQRFSSQVELNEYLENYSDPEELFYSLLYNYPTGDKYSWIVDDYHALDDYLDNGVSGTNGVEFGLVYVAGSDTDLFGYVRYIIEGSDASNKNINRGDIFYAVNGTQLTVSNYRELLFTTESYTLNMADYNNGIPTDNGISVDLTKEEIQEDPIYIANTFDVSGKKIGYLMYNSFTPLFDDDLNAVFLDFKSQGITDLVLDLRYNSGGSVSTASSLASMITGQFTNELFIRERWNDKWQEYFLNNSPESITSNFTDQLSNGNLINSLNLSNLVVLATGSSASASELVINGLDPYINVTTIGSTTEGKTVGSFTLYDSDNYSKNGVNPNHTWAMQPIVLEIQNKLEENHPEGIEPTINFPENYGDLGVLGEVDEPLLERAITFITTGNRSSLSSRNQFEENREFSSSRANSMTGSNMYIDFPF